MKRRRLDFRDFESLLADVDQLHHCGCTRCGNWDLAQVCYHLARALNASMNGSSRYKPWLVRVVLGPLILKCVLWNRWIVKGVRAPAAAMPPPGLDESEMIARLKEFVASFRAHTGELYPHPIFGRMSRDQWTQFHLIHSSHHLGFLVPNTTSSS